MKRTDLVVALATLAAKNWWKVAVLAAVVYGGFCAVTYVVAKTGVTVQKGDMVIEKRGK